MSKVSCDCVGCKQHRICNVCSHYCGGSHSDFHAPVVVPEPTPEVVAEQPDVVAEQQATVVPEPTVVATEPVAEEPAPEATQ